MAEWIAPSKISNGAEKLVLQALQFEEVLATQSYSQNYFTTGD
jgi:hypothetical protein